MQAEKSGPMEKFIPYEKLSKKKQRELNAARRGTWTINPVTRKPANPKAYNRKTARTWKDDSNSVPCFSAQMDRRTCRAYSRTPCLRIPLAITDVTLCDCGL